jgi:hypothetical protein
MCSRSQPIPNRNRITFFSLGESVFIDARRQFRARKSRCVANIGMPSLGGAHAEPDAKVRMIGINKVVRPAHAGAGALLRIQPVQKPQPFPHEPEIIKPTHPVLVNGF